MSAQSPKVSIITPAHNAARFLAQTIESVLAQTYAHWEMLVVDDGSTDETALIARSYAEKDGRVRLVTAERKGNAARARNLGLASATGRFVAYIDADDRWLAPKLERQVAFMLEKECVFSCASYEVIDEDGLPLGKTVRMPASLDYEGYLERNLIQTVGVMVDTDRVARELLVMPDLERRQDAATWFQILKAGHECLGLEDVLCEYRRTSGSLSSNKLKAIRGTWGLYRDVEKLSMGQSLRCFARYAVLAVWKRLYF